MWKAVLTALVFVMAVVVAGVWLSRRRPPRAEMDSYPPSLKRPARLPAAFDLDKVARAGPGRIVITRETYADWVKPALKDQDFDADQWFDALRGALLKYPATTRGGVDCNYLVEGETVVIDVLRVSEAMQQTEKGLETRP